MTRYRRAEKLGFGRFGVVYACSKDDDGAEVYAIKYLQTDYAQVEEAIKRFEREAAILDALDHPNVMPVLGRGTNQKGVSWFVMPRADESLKDAIQFGFLVDDDWIVEVFRAVLAGVAHAHERGVLHRDLKPSNILLKSGTPLVSDFGIAKQIDVDGTTLTRTPQEMGTLRYMAPEQSADAKRSGKPADVYALGKILGYMLTGKEPAPLVVDVSEVPERFRWFVDKCCREDPDERFADAGVALARFELLLRAPKVVLPPLEAIKKLAEDAAAHLATAGEAEAIEALDAELRAHAGQQAIYRRVVPSISRQVLRRWAQTQPHGFREMMRAYDRHIGQNGDLPFEYCDTVADFLRQVFTLTEDLAVKRLIIARLLEVGISHNRWHVRDVTVELLASLASPTDVAVAEEVIAEHQHAAAWIAEQALTRPLRAPIAEALREAARLDEAVGW